MSRLRVPKGPASANLYCAKCETYIGTFKNEWQHVTTSYALPTTPGEHFEPKVEKKTRIVPDGASSKAAEGCEMANVLCSSCSATIGQYCVKVKHKDQRYLLKTYLYKLTKVYLMEYATTKKKGFNFIEGEPARNDTASDPRISEIIGTDYTSNGSQTPTSLRRQESLACQDSLGMSQDPQPPIETFMILSRQMYEHGAAINDNFNRIVTTNGRITTESTRISDLESKTRKLDNTVAKLSSQQDSVDNVMADMRVNYSGYLQHEKAIQGLLATVEAQKNHIQRLSAELYNIRNQMSQKEIKPHPPKSPPRRGTVMGPSKSRTDRDVQGMRTQVEQHSDREESPVLGKRKRPDSDRLRSRKSLHRASSMTRNQDAVNIPTPESTQEPQQASSPVTTSVGEGAENSKITSNNESDGIDLTVRESPVDITGKNVQTTRSKNTRIDIVEPEVSSSMYAPDQTDKSMEATVIGDSPVQYETNIQSPADAIDFSDDDDSAAVTKPAMNPTSITPAETRVRYPKERSLTTEIPPKASSNDQNVIMNTDKSCQEAEPVSQRRQNRCLSCGRSGKMLCCEGCSTFYHLRCLKAPVRSQTLGDSNWICPNCVEERSDDLGIVQSENQFSSSKLQARLRLAQKQMSRGDCSVAADIGS